MSDYDLWNDSEWYNGMFKWIVLVFWVLAVSFLIASFNEVRESAEIKCTPAQIMGIILSQELRVCDEVQTPNCHHKVKAKYCLVPPKESK